MAGFSYETRDDVNSYFPMNKKFTVRQIMTPYLWSGFGSNAAAKLKEATAANAEYEALEFKKPSTQENEAACYVPLCSDFWDKLLGVNSTLSLTLIFYANGNLSDAIAKLELWGGIVSDAGTINFTMPPTANKIEKNLNLPTLNTNAKVLKINDIDWQNTGGTVSQEATGAYIWLKRVATGDTYDDSIYLINSYLQQQIDIDIKD